MVSLLDAKLSERQRKLLTGWLPGADIIVDHSWELQTTVLEVLYDGSRLIVKAGDETDHHIARELRCHHEWLAPWVTIGRAPHLVDGDAEAKILVTQYLEGKLVEGSPAQDDPDTYRQAGELLATFHTQLSRTDADYAARENAKTLRSLDGPHRIDADSVALIRKQIETWPTDPVTVVATHGDWQPRNWLTHEGQTRIIDFGRADLRPAMTDFARLARQDFERDSRLEDAFVDGYGSDPRDSKEWHRTLIREAVGTATWAHRVGDTEFEQQGLRMISRALADS